MGVADDAREAHSSSKTPITPFSLGSSKVSAERAHDFFHRCGAIYYHIHFGDAAGADGYPISLAGDLQIGPDDLSALAPRLKKDG